MPFATLVLAGAVALGGCSGEEAPDPSPSVSSGSSTASASPSASVTPSPTVTESGPAIPAAAREQTEAGAEAFVRFFFDELNTAWTEPQAGLIESLSDPTCEFCTNTEATATRLVADRHRYSTKPVEVTAVDQFVGAPTGQQYVAVTLVQRRSDVVDADGAVVRTDVRKVLDRYVAVVWAGDGWRLLGVEKTE